MNDSESSRRVRPQPPDDFDDDDDPALMPIERVLARVQHNGGPGPTWSARCPAHYDDRPSLSITERPDGQVLIYCHALCDTDNVLEAIGLEYDDLYASPYALEFGRPTYFAPNLRPTKADLRNRRESLEAFYRDSDPGKNLRGLARTLGLPVEALRRLGIGHTWGAWTFPERNGEGDLVGVALRYPDGRKRCVAGSRRGLTIPAGLTGRPEDVLYIAEGASDTAALISVGVEAIGRPAARSSPAMDVWVKDYVRRTKRQKIVVVADRDFAGQQGASRLAFELRDAWKFIHGGKRAEVFLAQTQKSFKDVRDQVVAGHWGQGLLLSEVQQ